MMKQKIAIIGGGIVGATAAFYLTTSENYDVTLFDESTGQGTRASAGIISPWLSKRRNKEWYEMVKQGAAFYPSLLKDVLDDKEIPKSIYQRVGTLLFTRKDKNLEELLEIGLKRRTDAPEIGHLEILSPEQIKKHIPIYTEDKRALFAEGGARVDGKELVDLLLETAQKYGMRYVPEKASLSVTQKNRVESVSVSEIFDGVILACGAWLPEMLEPLGYTVDVRPQKGQLVELQTDWDTNDWPVVMPAGEKDIIPFLAGKVLIGATHEDEAGYDLKLEDSVLEEMVKNASEQFSSYFTTKSIQNGRVGTRAYTSDFAPFFGEVPGLSKVYTASGLGSTGLTAGPIVGKCLAQLILGENPSLLPEKYPVSQYIQRRGN
ncbi:MAG TPA: FAD-dependent oxidoreductase [Atopostipes sp.]|nr:FAD-dependent oxidoreductase [Atopostipes sp.]